MRNSFPDEPDLRVAGAKLLEVDDLCLDTPSRAGGQDLLVDHASFEVSAHEILGIVGEEGSGATELVRAVAGLAEPWEGRIRFDGLNVAGLNRREVHAHRARIGLVTGDPASPGDMLPPSMTLLDVVAEPLRIQRACPRRERRNRAVDALGLVGIEETYANARSGELIALDRLRVALARAVVLRPRLLLVDRSIDTLEPTSRAIALDLVRRLADELSMSCLLATDHPANAFEISDRIMVMFAGRVVEVASREAMLENPCHPYSYELLAGVPLPSPSREARRQRLHVDGAGTRHPLPPETSENARGCSYRHVCPRAQNRCVLEVPALADPGLGHEVACHFPETIERRPSPVGEQAG